MNDTSRRGIGRAGLISMGVAFAFAGLLQQAQAQAGQVFAGKWIANLSKSQQHENHRFKSAEIRFEISEEVVRIIYTGVNMSGKDESGTSEVRPDGKEYPVKEAPGFVQTAQWQGSHILKLSAKKDGNVVGESRYEVSADGKSLTATVKSVDASGRPFDQVIVFDRQ